MRYLLSCLKNKKLNGYKIIISHIQAGRFIEEINFKIYLIDINWKKSIEPVIDGKYFSGRGKFYKPWLELYYNKIIKFESSKIIDLSKSNMDKKLFNYLSSILPPGSHIMVIYENHEETKNSLSKGIPAPATPLGYLLWNSGCTWFKDWYFTEGFLEGNMKLQGNKPLDEEVRKKNLYKIKKDLINFLDNFHRKERIYIKAKKRAENILQIVMKEID